MEALLLGFLSGVVSAITLTVLARFRVLPIAVIVLKRENGKDTDTN